MKEIIISPIQNPMKLLLYLNIEILKIPIIIQKGIDVL